MLFYWQNIPIGMIMRIWVIKKKFKHRNCVFATKGYDVWVFRKSSIRRVFPSRPCIIILAAKMVCLPQSWKTTSRRLLFWTFSCNRLRRGISRQLWLLLSELFPVCGQEPRVLPPASGILVFDCRTSDGFVAAREWWEKQQQLLKWSLCWRPIITVIWRTAENLCVTFLGTINTFIAFF